MALESACIPLPSEVILPFAGYLVSQGYMTFWDAVWAGLLGQTAGSLVAYYVGYYGGRPFLERYGRYFFLRKHELEVADKWFARYGEATAFFSRLLPAVRTFISLPAGIAGMPVWRFLVYSAAGAFPWTVLLVYAGVKMGEHWTDLRVLFHRLDLLLVLGAAGGLAWWWWRKLRRSAR